MGSFNVTGSYSGLPIRSGDECYAILCCVDDDKPLWIAGDVMILSLPVKVYYDDYGCFCEELDGLYTLYLRDLFSKPFDDIMHDFIRGMQSCENNHEIVNIFNRQKPFIIFEHRFFIEKIAEMVNNDEHYSPPYYWSDDNIFCLEDSDEFRLYERFRTAVNKFNIIPQMSHYGGQFDNLMPFRELYKSVVDFLDKDGYRETDKWTD